MYQRVVLTSGISIIPPHNEDLRNKFPLLFERGAKLTDEKNSLIDEVIQYRLDYYQQNLEKVDNASAELSLISALKRKSKLADSPVVTILHTFTLTGYTAAKIVKALLKKYYDAYVTLTPIRDLDVNDKVALNRSLGNYLGDLSELLREGEPTSTAFAPIGGYKVMTSLGYLVGALLNYPTIYLYESSPILHEIPPVKIDIDESMIIENHRFLKRMLRADYVDMNELSFEEKEIINRQASLFEIEDGFVALNPFGHYLCEQPKFDSYFKSSVYMAKSVQSMIDRLYPGNWQDVYKNIVELIRQHKSKNPDYRATLYHEADFATLNEKNIQYHLFKGGNSPVFRAIWKYDEMEDSYYLAYIWLHNHESYEREAAKRIGKIEENKDWIHVSEAVYE